MCKSHLAGMFVGLCSLFCLVAVAQQPAKAPPTKAVAPKKGAPADAKKAAATPAKAVETKPDPKFNAKNEKAIRDQAAAFMAAYNAKDVKALGEQFWPNAEYELVSGAVLQGRTAVQDHFAALFKEFPTAHGNLTVESVHFISPTMAIEHGMASAITEDGEPEAVSPYRAIRSSHDGRWLLANVRELPDVPESQITPHQRLEPLSWLVGDWVDESPASLVESNWHWSEDGNFLLHDFKAKFRGMDLLSGTQRIGWDPLKRQLRAWVFDSEGGFGESHWNWDGKRWLIHATGVRPDGTTTSAFDTLAQVGDNSFEWDFTSHVAGNELLPDHKVLVVRKAPKPAAASDTP